MMFSDAQKAYIETAKKFAENEMLPYANKWDEEKIFPLKALQKAAELGFAGIYVPEKFGGSGLSRLDAALIFEELSAACASTAAFLSIHNMATWMIAQYGNDSIHSRFLKRLIDMKYVASYCLTEPDSGSDAVSLSTRAERQGDYYILNGSKSFISGASESDIYLTMVRTGEKGHKGISCMIIEKNSEGLSFGKLERKMGWKK